MGFKVLLIDDDTAPRRMLRLYFESRGGRVKESSSAEEALGFLRIEEFDLVLLDNILPGLTGLEALQALSDAGKAAIVMMSGDTGETLREDARLLGARALLSKPFDLKELDALLEKLGLKA